MLRGRGRGGLCQIWPASIDHLISRIQVSSNRVQACVLDLPTVENNEVTSKVLWLNTYFCTNPHVQNFDETELLEILECIRNVIESTECDSVLWCGDTNSDFKLVNSRYVQIISTFIDNMKLFKSWYKFEIDFSYMSM